MSMILLTIFSCLDFITGLISIIVQAVIIANHDDCAYSKMGVGLWNGLLLIITAISLLVIASRKKAKKSDWMLVICAMTLMASLVQVGVASGVIYQLHSLQYFHHGPGANPLNGILDTFKPDNIPAQKDTLGDFTDTVFGIANKLAGDVISNTGKYGQVHACYKLLLNDDYFGSQRKTLEIILLCSGLIAIGVKIATFLALRAKRLAVSATIQYTQQNVSH
ncbi:uncharacterized protein LOC130701525 [Daphnia carinata]|uniref:uncharacterized protein LOC130701525 n=1 Tax=Daphnia carinata TaxID=120202 RepID=UPI002579DA37|nr:uncharacterized protein LOC130701525 [Daphnia carinata]